MPGIAVGGGLSPQEEVEKKEVKEIGSNPDLEDEEIAQQTYQDHSMGGSGKNPTQISMRAGPMDWADAIKYARDLRESGHSDWRLPTIEELATFVNLLDDDHYHWTRSIRDDNLGTWIAIRLSDGNWYSSHYYNDCFVRCVR